MGLFDYLQAPRADAITGGAGNPTAAGLSSGTVGQMPVAPAASVGGMNTFGSSSPGAGISVGFGGGIEQSLAGLLNQPSLGLGMGMGTGLSNLLLPNNFSPTMKAIFATVVAIPVVQALTTPSWGRNIFYSPVTGVAAGLYAGILLGQSMNQNSHV